MVRATFIGAAALFASAVMGKEVNMMGVEEAAEYRSGAVHAKIMSIKMVCFVKYGAGA